MQEDYFLYLEHHQSRNSIDWFDAHEPFVWQFLSIDTEKDLR